MQEGKPAEKLIPAVINETLSRLSIPRKMRWGDKSSEFIRPVHWIVLLFGNEVIEFEILGVPAGKKTYGHRYHHPDAIELKSAGEYLQKLKKAKVWLNDSNIELQDEITLQARNLAEEVNGNPVNNESESELVTEIAALVEWPVALRGSFDEKFLTLPEELLISVLEKQQRYFAVRDKESGKLLPCFIAISNIKSKDMDQVRKGNERVIVPRLSDAMFFWETDKAASLASRECELDGIVFQKKLGSIGDKSRRIASLACVIADKLKFKSDKVKRASLLSKCDLVTSLVGEFPELQGITGKYLAQNDKEDQDICLAIEEHYQPRFAGDQLPESEIGQIVALADKLDTLAGIFGIGQQPGGAKDPFALRRAALGVVRILVEKKIPLSISELVEAAYSVQPENIEKTQTDLINFILERAKGYFVDHGHTITAIDSVLQPAGADTTLYTLPDIITEASTFIDTEDGKSLATSNKRITNILKKSGFEVPFGMKPADIKQKPDEKLFEPIETEFWHELQKFGEQSLLLKDEEKFSESLRVLTNLAEPTELFFDNVMVNTDDENVRNNRITLLQYARVYMNQVADLSLMAN